MAQEKLIYILIFALVLVSCSRDDCTCTPGEPKKADPTNDAPGIDTQVFNAAETINDTFVIGTVPASDAEEDALTFSILEDASGLFEITKSGELSLVAGENLDEESSIQHIITVGVNDGNGNVSEANITINVLDRFEGKVTDPEWFVFTWEATQNEIIGFTGNPFIEYNFTYNFIVDWGDDVVEEIIWPLDNDEEQGQFGHTYKTTDIYTVAIKGELPYIYSFEGNLATIEQWGTIQWKAFDFTFQYQQFQITATDSPDLSQVTSLQAMFANSTFSGDLTDWDTSTITSMRQTFNQADFIADISGWDTSNVTDMYAMFGLSTNFNVDISGWDTGKVTNMEGLFIGASSFNQDISEWDTSNVTDMRRMFFDATSFNQNLSNWETSKVGYMNLMFKGAIAFDQNLGSWNISSVTTMTDMLNSSGLSPINYSATLQGWANASAPTGIELGASGLNHCNDLQTAESGTYLINTKQWTIIDEGSISCQ